MRIFQNTENAKEEYFAKMCSAIKHSNIVLYKKLIHRNINHIFKLSQRQTKQFSNRFTEVTDFDHLQFLALFIEDTLFFKTAYDLLLSCGLAPNGSEKHRHLEQEKTVLNLLIQNGNKKRFSEGALEYILSLDSLFKIETNNSSFPHKLSFISALKQNKLINEEVYYRLFDLAHDDDLKKIFPLYFSFTKEEIKKLNLFHTVNYKPIDVNYYCFDFKNIEQLALKMSNRKSKQVKKYLFHYCFESLQTESPERFLRFLNKIKHYDDQLFYWVLELYSVLPNHCSINELVMIVDHFNLFQKNSTFAITKNRIERLFELRAHPTAYIQEEKLPRDPLYFIFSDNEESDDLVAEGLYADDFDDDPGIDSISITDTINMMVSANESAITYNLKDFKDAQEFHDFLSLELDNINSINVELNQSEIKNLHNRKFSTYKIVVPQQSHDLKLIGRMLNICVGTASYDKKVLKKKSSIIFFTKDNKLVACIEFINTHIIQMKAKNNNELSQDLHKKFKMLLEILYQKEVLTLIDESLIIADDYSDMEDYLF